MIKKAKVLVRGYLQKACGIELNNKIYVLDKELPILSFSKWLIKWNKKIDKVNVYLMEVENKTTKLKKVEISCSNSNDIKNFDKLENIIEKAC